MNRRCVSVREPRFDRIQLLQNISDMMHFLIIQFVMNDGLWCYKSLLHFSGAFSVFSRRLSWASCDFPLIDCQQKSKLTVRFTVILRRYCFRNLQFVTPRCTEPPRWLHQHESVLSVQRVFSTFYETCRCHNIKIGAAHCRDYDSECNKVSLGLLKVTGLSLASIWVEVVKWSKGEESVPQI